MATITITGTADQLRRLGRLIAAAAEESKNPRSVTVTLDNGVANSVVGITDGNGKRRDG